MARAYYLGRVNTAEYELGTNSKFFHKGAGFAFQYHVAPLPAALVEDLFGIKLKPGELVRLKKGTIKWETLKSSTPQTK